MKSRSRGGEIYYARSEVTYLQVFSNEIDIIFPQLNQKERQHADCLFDCALKNSEINLLALFGSL